VRTNQTTQTSRIVHSRSAAIAKSRKSASTITRPDVAVQLRSRIARLPARKSVQMKRCRSPTESGVVSLLYLHGPTSSPKSFHPLADRGISLACRDIRRSSVAKVFGGWIRPAFPVCISLRFRASGTSRPVNSGFRQSAKGWRADIAQPCSSPLDSSTRVASSQRPEDPEPPGHHR
jgi:hypothetical protein